VSFPTNLSEVFEAVDIITGERAALKKIKLDDGKEGVSFIISTKLIILKHIVLCVL
jgi:cyclin-dependent kinase 12/13